MSKSNNVFIPKMTHYFRMPYFIHFLFNLNDLKSYGCTKLNFTLILRLQLQITIGEEPQRARMY
jgi:hypothetical protein